MGLLSELLQWSLFEDFKCYWCRKKIDENDLKIREDGKRFCSAQCHIAFLGAWADLEKKRKI